MADEAVPQVSPEPPQDEDPFAPPVAKAPTPKAEAPEPEKPIPPRAENGRFVKREEAEGPEPAKPQHSKRVLRMAADLGLTQEEIDGSSPEALDDIVYHLNRERLQSRAEEGRNRTVQDSPPPNPLDGLDFGVDEAGKPYDPSELHPSILNVVKSLKARIDQLEGAHRSQVNQTLTQRADAWYAKNAELFGQGTIAELPKDSADFMRRRVVWEMANQDKSQLSLEQKLDKAKSILYPSKGEKPAPKAKAPSPHDEEVAAWNRGTLALPTQRKGGAEPKGLGAAKNAFEKGMRELELNGAGDTGDEDAF